MGTICSICGTENPTGVRYCAQCAAELANVCPSCGFENPAGFKFCGQCGTNLATARLQRASDEELRRLQGYIPAHLMEKMVRQGRPQQGERRTVTVLFSDITGFTSFSEKLDPEEVYAIMDDLFRGYVDAIYRFEGTVDKFTGDGLMALFGAPVAHENDPERAIRAALEMQRFLSGRNAELEAQYGVQLRSRIGLNSGEVVVGGLGSDLRLDYTAIGDTVNVAARLEQAAQPGSVLVSDSVYQATEALFEFASIGEIHVKGRSAAVTAYQVVKEKELPGRTRGIRGLEARLVGRERELEQLRGAVEACQKEQRGRIILVDGEAGMGKSRLTAEWLAGLPAAGFTILRGSAFSHTASFGQWVMRDLLRQSFGLRESDSLEVAQARLHAAVEDLLGPASAEVLPYLQHLISPDLVESTFADRIVHLAPAELRQQTFLAVRDFLVAQAKRRPVIAVFEDIHWMDRLSLDLLLFLLGLVESVPIVFYGISRPDEGMALGEIATQAKQQYPERLIQVRLRPLPDTDVNALVDELLALPDLPESFRRVIPERAEGNPFFLEEIIRMLIDRAILERDEAGRWRLAQTDLGQLEVPRTLRGLILTRVDSLDDLQRDVLQCAAVIGRSFSPALLAEVVSAPAGMESSLRDLQEHGLINTESSVPAPLYAFHHALTQEAVYDTLLRQRKRALHRAVGGAIEKVYAQRLDEQIEILAQHFYLADVPDRALGYLVQAGPRAASRYANEEALGYYRRAVKLLEKTAATLDQKLAIQEGLADIYGFMGEYDTALSHYQAALDLAGGMTEQGALRRQAAIQRKAARAWERRGDYEAASGQLSSLLQTLEHAEDREDRLERARVINDLGWVAFRQGEMDAAQRWTTQALAELESAGDWQDAAAAYNRLAGISFGRGEWHLAAQYAERGLMLREQIGFTYGLAMSYNNLSVIYLAGGDWEKGIRYAEKSLEMKQRMGDVEGAAISYNNLGMAYKDRGDLERARNYLLKSLATAKRIKNANLLASALSNLGQVALRAGSRVDAIGYFEESLQVARASGSKEQMAEALWLLAESWMRAGNLERAEQHLERAEQLAGECGSRSARAMAERTRASLERLNGRGPLAMEMLQHNLEEFHDLRNELEAGRTMLQMSLTLASAGQIAAARQQVAEALACFERLGAVADATECRRQMEEWGERGGTG